MLRLNYIVYAPSFDPNNGGAIFLHELVHALKARGEVAALWPMKPLPIKDVRSRVQAAVKNIFHSSLKPAFSVNPDLDTPVAKSDDLQPETIVVYPEITLGNPLKSANVVRWLLYKPGLQFPYSFGRNEMYFRVGEITDIPEITGGATDLFLWKVNSVYRNEKRSNRCGNCFIVRKGANKARIPETANAIQIDGLAHEAIARIFNECEVFYSYDEATLYSQYAAICGCLSVIVPGMYASREEWVKNHELGSVGVAYGLTDLEHARTTQHQVIDLLREQELRGMSTVDRFIAMTQERFQKR